MSAELFWEVAEQHLAAGAIERGTIMGQPCVRAAGNGFVAMPDHRTGALIARLSEDRVGELIGDDIDLWQAVVGEAIDHAKR